MEDAVGHLKGVTSAKFGGIRPQKLDVGVKKGEWVNLEAVWKLIQRQGYRVRSENTHVVLRGIASKADSNWFLVLRGESDLKTIPIEPASQHHERGSDRPGLAANLADGAEVEVAATVTVKDKQIRLVPHRINVVK